VRIISGQWRGRPLAAPKGEATRPTADRTREGLFSMLVSRLGSFEGLAVADMFAGSGALGLEALSRGAETCLFVEHDKPALDALRANAEKLGIARPDIRAQSVMTLGLAAKPLDLILMDPPYGTGAGSVALDKLARQGWTNEATLVSIETAKPETVEVKGFEIIAERVYGKAKISLLRQLEG
jgi:16S rRNA (guanine966-N2)-methyltransferase